MNSLLTYQFNVIAFVSLVSDFLPVVLLLFSASTPLSLRLFCIILHFHTFEVWYILQHLVNLMGVPPYSLGFFPPKFWASLDSWNNV